MVVGTLRLSETGAEGTRYDSNTVAIHWSGVKADAKASR